MTFHAQAIKKSRVIPPYATPLTYRKNIFANILARQVYFLLSLVETAKDATNRIRFDQAP